MVLKPDALRIGISASDAAITLGIAPGMAKEHLLKVCLRELLLQVINNIVIMYTIMYYFAGLLCRDVSPDGFRFYVNIFQEINPDDVYL